MKLYDETISERRVTASLAQGELEEILIKTVAKESGFQIDRNTKTNVRFFSEDCGVDGFKTRAEVRLINDLDNKDQP